MDATGLDWTWLGWVGPESTGLDSAQLDCTGLDLPRLDWAGRGWIGVDWTGLGLTSLDSIGLNPTGLDKGISSAVPAYNQNVPSELATQMSSTRMMIAPTTSITATIILSSINVSPSTTTVCRICTTTSTHF